MPACHQATGYRPRSSAIRRFCQRQSRTIRQDSTPPVVDHHGIPGYHGRPAEPLGHRKSRVGRRPGPLQPIATISCSVTSYSPTSDSILTAGRVQRSGPPSRCAPGHLRARHRCRAAPVHGSNHGERHHDQSSRSCCAHSSPGCQRCGRASERAVGFTGRRGRHLPAMMDPTGR
jgi:hypothetical protein